MADIRIVPALGAINVTGSADFRGDSASTVLFVSGSGNVGVGTSNPISKLHVAGAIKATAVTGNLLGTSTDTGRAISILNSGLAHGESYAMTLGQGNSSNNQAEITYNLVATGSTSNRLSLGLYNSADTLNVVGTGRVGIGTTSPSSKFEVAGQIRSINTNDQLLIKQSGNNGSRIGHDALGLYFSNDDTSLATLRVYGGTAGAERFVIGSNGALKLNNYGSGTFTGTAARTLAVDSSGNVIEISNTSLGGSGTTNRVAYWTDANTLAADADFFFDGTNVGIGNTAPAVKLQVIGNIGVGAGTYNGGVYANSSTTAVDNNWGFDFLKTPGQEDYSTRLKYYPATGDSRRGGIWNSRNNAWVIYGDSNDTPNVIIPSGSVGIGTTSPGYTLDVNGTIAVPSFIRLINGGPTITFLSEAYGINLNGDATHPVQVANASLLVGLSGAGSNYGTGNLYVGGNSFLTGDLSVTGKITAREFHTSFVSASIIFQSGSTQFGNSSDDTHIFTGNVGLGTTTPGARLHIATPDPATNFAVIDFRNPDFGIFAKTNSIAGRGNTIEFTATDYNTNGSVVTRDVLTLRPEGNVGIGTTSPNFKLDVNGTGRTLDFSIKNSANTETLDLFLSPSVFNAFIDYPTNRDLIFRNKTSGTALTIASTGAATFSSSVTATSFVKTSGTSAQFLKADGSVDSSTYITAFSETDTLSSVTGRGASTSTASTFSGGITTNLLSFTAPTGDPSPIITARTVPAGQGAANEITELILFHSNDPNNGAGPDYITLRSPAIRLQTYNDASVDDINDNLGSNDRLRIEPNGTIKLSSLTSNGFVKTSGGDGALSIDTSTYLTAEADTLQTVTTRGSDTTTGMTIAGNVGIGTTAPTNQLNIVFPSNIGKDTVQGIIRICGQANTENAGTIPSAGTALEFYNKWNGGGSTAEYSVGRISGRASQGYAGSLQFDVAPTQSPGQSNFLTAMSILRDGNVGIGTTSPATKLDIAGTLGFTAGAASAIIRRTGVNGSNGISIQGNANDTVSDTNAGASIFVGGGVIGDTFEGNIVLTAYGSIVDSNRNSIRFSNRSGVNTVAERMRINHLGAVGIGTTAPTTNLQVYQVGGAGNNYLEGTIQVGGVTSVLGAALSYSAQSSGYVNLVNLNDGGGANSRISFGFGAITSGLPANNVMTVNQSGNVGIGTNSPANKLQVVGTGTTINLSVVGNIKAGGTGAAGGEIITSGALGNGNFASFRHDDTNAYITVTRTVYDGHLILQPYANVGIGVTNPSAKLHVAGTIINSTGVGGTGDSGIEIGTGNRVGFDESGVRSWTVKAASGNLNLSSGDGNGWYNFTGKGIIATSFTGSLQGNITGTAASETLQTVTTRGAATTTGMTIAGNVGIGTTNPVADGLTIRREGGDRKILLKLDRPNTAGLQTALQFTVSDIMVGQIQHEYAASNYNHMSFTLRSVAGSDIIPLWLENSGNVGIGNTSPSGKLHVTSVGGDGAPILRITGTASDSFNWASSTIFANLTAGETAIHQIGKAESQYNSGHYGYRHVGDGSSANMMTIGMFQADYLVNILGTGNVGIGITTPEATLHIAKTGTDDQLVLGSIATNRDIAMFMYSGTTKAEVLRFQSAFRLIIGNGSAITQQSFITSGTEKMTITSGGNVGIGTTVPGEKLDVIGNIALSGIFKGTTTGENKNFASYDWHWLGRRYATYVGDVRLKLYEYFYSTTATVAEAYVNCYDMNSVNYMGENIWGDVHDYRAIFTTHIYVKRQFTVSSVLLNGDDPYALWIDGAYVTGADSCCVGVTYSYTFTQGWHRIDLIYSEAAGGHFVQLGWNPKDYTDYIAAMTPFGPVNFFDTGDVTMRNNRVGIGTTNPSEKLSIEGGNIIFNADNAAANYYLFLNKKQGQDGGILFNRDNGNDWQVANTSTTGNLVFYSYGTSTEAIVFQKASGNVGIGSVSPAFKLDVSGAIRATGDVLAFSDARVKENIVTLENSLDLVTRLRGVRYNRIGESQNKIGVIAQEVLEVLPEVVQQDQDGNYSVAYGNLAGLFIESIKQHQQKIQTLEDRISVLEKLLGVKL